MRIFQALFLIAIVALTCSMSAQAQGEPWRGHAVFDHGVGTAPGAPRPPRVVTRHLASIQGTCAKKGVYSRWTFRNLVGRTLWRYVEQVYFCFTGTQVTYFYRYRWAEVPSLLPLVRWNPWEFKGHTDSNCANEHCFIRDYRAPSRVAWTKGAFAVCGIYVAGACNHQQATAWIIVRGDGTADHNEHGG